MASGDTLAIWTAYGNEPPLTNAATLDYHNQHPVLDFDAATDEEAVFSSVMPGVYAAGGVTLELFIAMTTATTANVVFQAAFENMASQDLNSDSFAVFQGSGQVAVPVTAGQLFVATVTFTNGAQMDSVASGNPFRLKIRRDADDTSATDDATGDAEVRLLHLKET